MSSRHNNDTYTPPPPSSESPGWLVGVVLVVAMAISLLVLVALQQTPRTAVELGTALFVLGLFLAVGMVAQAFAVRVAAAVGLVIGGIIAIYLGADRGLGLWMAGGVFFFACAGFVMFKDRFIPARS